MTTAPAQPTGPRVGRRTVLVGAAAAAALAGAGRFGLGGGAVDALRALAEGDGPRLSVGYTDAAMTGGAALPRAAAVVPASQVRAAGLGSRALVRVVGLTGQDAGPAAAPGLAGLHLDTLYPTPGGGAPRRHLTWTHRADPIATSPPARLGVAVDGLSLGMALTAVDQAGTASPEATAVLSAGGPADVPGAPRLRPGTYLFALAPEVWDARTRLPSPADPAWAELASIAVTVAPA